METSTSALATHEDPGRCVRCFARAPTKKVAFRQNIGALVMRFHSSVEGELCKSCIHAEFWKRTLITSTVGWFGTISLVVTPIFIVMNAYNYATAATLPAPTPSQRNDDHNPAAFDRLRGVVEAYVPRMLSGAEPPERVLGEMAAAAKATPGQARVFWDAIAR